MVKSSQDGLIFAKWQMKSQTFHSDVLILSQPDFFLQSRNFVTAIVELVLPSFSGLRSSRMWGRLGVKRRCSERIVP